MCIGDDYSSWSEILVAIGFASHEVDQAVSGQGVGSPSIDIDQLDKFFASNEIENYYLRQIKKLWEEGDCRAQVVHGWLYGIAVHLAENCGRENCLRQSCRLSLIICLMRLDMDMRSRTSAVVGVLRHHSPAVMRVSLWRQICW